MAKAAHFSESGTLVSAFGAALDSFSGGAGHAIYLAGREGKFERAHSSLASVPVILDLDDDMAVSMRASRQGVILAEEGRNYYASLALPMLQGGNLKGFILLGPKSDAQNYRPDEQSLLEFAATQIGMDLNRLHAAQLTEQVQQQHHERARVQQELDSLKQERATLILALSKVGSVA